MIRIDNLTIAYHHRPAVQHITGCFTDGSLTAIVGPNGAGKSTLLAALAGRIKPTEGHIRIAAADQKRIAYLPQQSEIDRSFPICVLDVVMLGLWNVVGLFGGVNGKLRQQARQALAAVGLAEFEDRLIADLSAGQFQRVLFARVLLQNAKIILLDEPFNAIDARTTEDLLTLIRHWHQQQRTVIAVLHDLDQVREYFPHTLLLAREVVRWSDTANALGTEPLLLARHVAASDDKPYRQREPA